MPAYDRTDQLPDVLQPVTLRVRRTTGTVVVAPTRVLDLEAGDDGDLVVVACPAGVDPNEHNFEAELAWTHPLGRVSCPISTHPARRPYGAVWVLTPLGAARRVQERRHFRARMAVPLRLAWEVAPEPEPSNVPGGEGITADGITVDVSEGGVLALLRGDPPEVGALVDTTLMLDGAELAGAGTVVRHVPYPGGVGVGLRFCDPNANADLLRRAAFDAERRRVRAAR